MVEKLLVIGAGIGQVPIIKKAKEKGVHVTVVTVPGNWPALQYADDAWFIDIYDRETIATKAKENNITAVISDQNDLMMPTVAFIAEKLGIPGNTFDQVYSYCNKNLFRDNCDKIGVPAPKHIAIDDENFDVKQINFPLPWIVKPADSQSSIGIRKVNTYDEFAPALKKAIDSSKTHGAIVEEFFIGKELVCEGFITNGKYYNLAFADRKYFDLGDMMIPSQTLFPSIVSKEIKNKILECEQKMSAYINPSFGITHSEYLYDEQTKEIRVVETALRGGGVYISSHLIPYATGIDINEVLLQKALGKEVDCDDMFAHKKEAASGYVCFYLKKGKVISISGLNELKELPFVKMVAIDSIKIGEESPTMLHKGMRKGPILVTGKDRADLERNIEIVQKTLNIEIETGTDTVSGIIWE